MTPGWTVVIVAALVCTVASTATPTGAKYIPFDVVFETSEPLGLRLDAALTVLGFSRKADGSPTHAEASGLIKVSDTLVQVNGKSVKGLDLQRAVMEIRDAELPKVTC
jgi:C-terminal processing protease CtpA/Prc